MVPRGRCVAAPAALRLAAGRRLAGTALAARPRASPAWRACAGRGRLGPDRRRRAAASVPDAPNFAVGPVPGKGLGVLATRDIRRGELVIAEAPAILYNSRGGGAAGSWRESLQREFEALSSDQQGAVMSLHDACVAGEPKSLEGIVNSNAFEVARGPHAFDVALCLACSRLNHSCAPNCEQTWDEDAREVRVHASTAVRAGEELCNYYVELAAPAAERARQLWARYRFRCACPACSGELLASDRRRSRLRLLERAIRAADGGPEREIELVSEALRLYDSEALHLYSHRKVLGRRAFELSLGLGDLEGAKRWVQLSYESSVICHGPGHRDTLWLQRYLEAPESHPAYRPRHPALAAAVAVALLLLGAFAAQRPPGYFGGREREE